MPSEGERSDIETGRTGLDTRRRGGNLISSPAQRQYPLPGIDQNCPL